MVLIKLFTQMSPSWFLQQFHSFHYNNHIFLPDTYAKVSIFVTFYREPWNVETSHNLTLVGSNTSLSCGKLPSERLVRVAALWGGLAVPAWHTSLSTHNFLLKESYVVTAPFNLLMPWLQSIFNVQIQLMTQNADVFDLIAFGLFCLSQNKSH